MLAQDKKIFTLNKLQLYHREQALFPPVSVQLQAGELLVVMGPSGCGKSSLLAAIAGTLAPELSISGSICLAGQSLQALPIERRGIGLQYQHDLLFPHLDVGGNLLFAVPRGANQQRQNAVAQALISADLAGFAQRDVATLSGGQRARVSLLRTLLAKPKLLLLDEPFSRLDADLRQDFRSFVFEQIAAMSIPALLVSHDPQDCPANHYYALAEGKMMTLEKL